MPEDGSKNIGLPLYLPMDMSVAMSEDGQGRLQRTLMNLTTFFPVS